MWRLVPLVAPIVLASVTLSACSSTSNSASVLLVGTLNGKAGAYHSIEAAVDAAKSGDWILVAPGDYHERADHLHPPTDPQHGAMGGVYITTPNLHLRGMDRATVIVDGTKPGSAPCSSDPSAQDYGVTGSDGKAVGRNGILVWKADNVSIENLTACNWLAGTGDSGNPIWWNGGANSGKIGMTGYTGRYLTATATYFPGAAQASQYGIFAGNAAGPASWDQLYASNFNDSGMYVGACQQVCDVTINHAWMENNALGYSGTNSGGAVVIENSQFDNNADGLDTNSQIAGDAPGPQNGACPNNGTSPVTHTHSCWAFIHNNVHDNNNINTPIATSAAALAPVGTGMTLTGGRNDTVMDNTFSHNNAWGVLFLPYPDSNTPDHGQSCSGVQGTVLPGALASFGCFIDPMGNALRANHFSQNASDGYPGNADYGLLTVASGQPSNCFQSNTAPQGSTPTNLEQLYPTCGVTTTATHGELLVPAGCAAGLIPCPTGVSYPKPTAVVMHPLPPGVPSMSNPCDGVPSNPWCSSGSASSRHRRAPAVRDPGIGGLGATTRRVSIRGGNGWSFSDVSRNSSRAP
jgi:hypothetical protein